MEIRSEKRRWKDRLQTKLEETTSVRERERERERDVVV